MERYGLTIGYELANCTCDEIFNTRPLGFCREPRTVERLRFRDRMRRTTYMEILN